MPRTQSKPGVADSHTSLLTIPQVAAELQVCRATVYARIAAGVIPVVDVGVGRSKTRVRRFDLDAYIAGLSRTVPVAS